MFSFLSIGWGLISDIDIESECLRVIGGQRFTVWSFHRLVNLRTYHGTISYLPATNVQTPAEQQRNSLKSNQSIRSALKHSLSCNNALDCAECHGDGDCEACDTEFGDVLSFETSTGQSGPGTYRPRLDSWYSATSRKSAYYSTADSVYQSVSDEKQSFADNNHTEFEMKRSAQMFGPASKIPALTTTTLPDTWTIESGEYIMVHGAYQTHIAADCQFAPQSQLSDGVIWLCIIRAGASRQDLLKFLLGLSNGTHIPVSKNDYIQMIPVTAFRIEPHNDRPAETSHGHFTVDGELVEYGPIQAEIFRGISNVMVPKYST